MKALVGAFNQEKALVGAFSVIVQPVVETMEYYTALILGNWLVLWFNLIHTAYFVLQQIPGIGTRWMNYVLPFANLAFLPCILSVKAKYKRSKVDNGGDHISA